MITVQPELYHIHPLEIIRHWLMFPCNISGEQETAMRCSFLHLKMFSCSVTLRSDKVSWLAQKDAKIIHVNINW